MSDGRGTAENPLDVGAILEALRGEVRAQRLARGSSGAQPGRERACARARRDRAATASSARTGRCWARRCRSARSTW